MVTFYVSYCPTFNTRFQTNAFTEIGDFLLTLIEITSKNYFRVDGFLEYQVYYVFEPLNRMELSCRLEGSDIN